MRGGGTSLHPRLFQVRRGSMSTDRRSRLLFGSADLRDDDVTPTLLDRYYEAGGRRLDLANVYGDGESREGDREVARAAAALRDELELHVKGCHPPYCDPSHVAGEVERSRMLLDVDVLDSFTLHRDDRQIPVEAFAEALLAQVDRGTIRASASRTGRSRASRSCTPPSASMPRSSPSSRTTTRSPTWSSPTWPGTLAMSQDELAALDGAGVTAIAWAALAAGFFAGRDAASWAGDENLARRAAGAGAGRAPRAVDAGDRARLRALPGAAAVGGRRHALAGAPRAAARRARDRAVARRSRLAPARLSAGGEARAGRLVGGTPGEQQQALDLSLPALRPLAARDDRAHADRAGGRREPAPARAHRVRARGAARRAHPAARGVARDAAAAAVALAAAAQALVDGPPGAPVVVDGLDVVAVGVEHEGGVVARVVAALAGPRRCRGRRPRARAWNASTVSSPGAGNAMCTCSLGAPPRDERERPVALRDVEAPVALALDVQPEGRADRRVEAPALREVCDADPEVVDVVLPGAGTPW